MGTRNSYTSEPGLSKDGKRPAETQEVEAVEIKEGADLKARLATFKTWPLKNISACSLAGAGFQYTGYSDKVLCTVCGLTISNLNVSFTGHVYHAALSPGCKFVKDNSNDKFINSSQKRFKITKPRIGYSGKVATGAIIETTGPEKEVKAKVFKDCGHCLVCLDKGARFVSIPCGHIALCPTCVKHTNNKCPVCRAPVTSTHKVYFDTYAEHGLD